MNIEEVVIILFTTFVAFIAGMMFLKGYFHEGSNKAWRRIIDPDKIFFPHLSKKELITAADRLAFWICILTGSVIFILGVLIQMSLVYINQAVNHMVAWLFIGIVASWIIRYVFIYLYKDKPINKIPRLWPPNDKGKDM